MPTSGSWQRLVQHSVRRAPRSHREGEAAGPAELAELRRILVGPEQDRLSRIEGRLDPEAIGAVLPAAAAASQERDGEGLSEALQPAILSAIRGVVAREPQLFVDTVVPVIGPAIRKSVSQALRALVQQLNETLARGLSLRALRWRWEAARTGRPFAEVVLLRSLIYRVEQVFLVHRETGLLLRHLTAPDTPEQDPDQVAAMLTAIDDFVHDAFRETGRLARFDVGELSGWVEHGGGVALVALVRGTPPGSYVDVLQAAHERLLASLHDELATFDGDVTPFERADPILATCFLAETVTTARPTRSARPLAAMTLAALLIVALLVGFRLRHEAVQRRTFEAMRDALSRAPGLIVTSATLERDGAVFRGLRDPLAATPESIALPRDARDARGRLPAAFDFAPFYSLDPSIVRARASSVLHPPPGVELSVDAAGALVARGAAPRTWIDELRTRATLLPGVNDLQTQDLRAIDEAEIRAQLGRRLLAVTNASVHFPRGSALPLPDQAGALEELSRSATSLVAEAKAAGRSVELEVVGFADTTGEGEDNALLSGRRARFVADFLRSRGLSSATTRAMEGGEFVTTPSTTCANSGLHGDACARRVDVRPILSLSSEAGE